MMETCIKKLPGGEAVGLDDVPEELFKFAGSARKLVKQAWKRRTGQIEVPTHWRGGRLIEIDKGKGDPTEPELNRLVQATAHMGKGLEIMLYEAI